MKRINLISNIILSVLAAIAAGMVFYFVVTFFGIVSALTVLGYMLYVVIPISLVMVIIKNHKKNTKKATAKK